MSLNGAPPKTEHVPPPIEAADHGGNRTLLFLTVVSLAVFVVGWAGELGQAIGPSLVAGLVFLGAYCQTHAKLRVFTFTFFVFASVAAAMFYPWMFDTWGGFDLGRLIVPLIQLIMFGMGASLSLGDFLGALKMPKAVGVGMFLQFTVMPVLGWAIAMAFGFEPEVAAGIILIGSCSGGVASNVMAYLAHANVALSVTMTACSTLMAPIMTPLAMKLLAGRLIEIDFVDMMISIIELVIIPIGAGLVANKLLAGRKHLLEKALPVVSMAAICFILAIIAEGSRDELLAVGLLLLGASLIHNLMGYWLGYLLAGLVRLPETDRRTVAFEVGMQNGGMGVGLATGVLNSASAALGPAVFGTWMNITGSTLASWWRERPPKS